MQIENHKEEVPFEFYEEKFRALVPGEVQQRLKDVGYDGKEFTVKLLGREYAIAHPDYAIRALDGGKVPPLPTQTFLLRYLLECKDVAWRGEWKTFREMPWGEMYITLESYRKGLFEIQDLASQCVGLVCAPRPGSRWLDACAGAGGKTLQLAQLMKRKGNVTASDLRSYKLEDLRRRARRAGFPNITTKENIAASGKVKHPFDGVLIDAPCSCSGVWRRNPGAQWILSAEEINDIAVRQLEILETYAAAVRAGGVLVYATCSVFDIENVDVVRKFMDKHPEFKLDPFPNPLTGDIAPGMLRIDGGLYNCDTLFAARLRKFE